VFTSVVDDAVSDEDATTDERFKLPLLYDLESLLFAIERRERLSVDRRRVSADGASSSSLL